MHILVVNDDGPPSNQSSPYVHSFVKTLQDAGHTVSVILPHIQRSWIGKAHFVGQLTKPTYFHPGTLHEDDGTTHQNPLPAGADDVEEWILVNGSPATCTQLGLYHFFQDRGPVDLVVSGPNYGRNSTALFSLSSGTIGGAMEAAVCRRKAVALSYAFYSRDHDPVLIAGASRISVKLIEHLYHNWAADVDFYSVNVPLVEGVEDHKIMITNILQNYWSSGSSFEEIEATDSEEGVEPDKQEKDIRHQKVSSIDKNVIAGPSRHKHKHFKWAPRFTDIHKSIEENPSGNDGWAIREGYISVTPLKASFMHASSHSLGELKLTIPPQLENPAPKFYAYINYDDPYVQPLILSALSALFPPATYTLLPSITLLPLPTSPLLQISSYENLSFTHLHAHPSTSLANSYVIRKALIRKHYLAHTVSTWLAKNPESPLARYVPHTLDLELDYAEFLDEALLEAYELHESFSRNKGKAPSDREWWILKPSMSDRGQGIRLFSTESELRVIFEAWDADESDSSSEHSWEADASSLKENTISPPFDPTAPILSATALAAHANNSTSIITSQLRHFVVQPYIHPPLLFPSHDNRKFHVRAYVLAVGALRVYVYREMLALFASVPYVAPGSSDKVTEEKTDGSSEDNQDIRGEEDLRPHLTNTCLQDGPRKGSVLRFWDLPSSLPPSPSPSSSVTPSPPTPTPTPTWHHQTFAQILTTVSTLFTAAALSQVTSFQPLPNAFEVFGVDFLIDSVGKPYLLEVNAFPDFGQTGDELREGVVGGFWRGVVRLGVGGFFGRGGKGGREEEEEGMVKVLRLDMGRG